DLVFIKLCRIRSWVRSGHKEIGFVLHKRPRWWVLDGQKLEIRSSKSETISKFQFQISQTVGVGSTGFARRANMLEMNAALGAMDGKIRRENVKGKIMVHI
ncbi:MAG: hypothetical protein ACYTBZ_29370, partial [Planctomycetota bacterium]